jgi:hypothetical protein
MKEIERCAARIQELCSLIPPLVERVPANEFTAPRAPGKWSKKQVMGHLIDSAAINHQRFVRIQLETEPDISYDQDQWNLIQDYNNESTTQILNLWRWYNLHLAHLIKLIPEQNLERKGSRKGQSAPLHFYITDYVVHLEHHLKQIIDY